MSVTRYVFFMLTCQFVVLLHRLTTTNRIQASNNASLHLQTQPQWSSHHRSHQVTGQPSEPSQTEVHLGEPRRLGLPVLAEVQEDRTI